jgi:hypothetical protein
MIEDRQARAKIARSIGTALDDLVQERMRGLVEEPDITSRKVALGSVSRIALTASALAAIACGSSPKQSHLMEARA